ncbi:MAG: cytochrome c biogenesis CcdA family protein [Promethearchaeota archaeon]
MDLTTYLIALAGGLLSFFNPCSLVLIPSFVSYVGAESTSAKRGLLLSLAFGLGFSVVYAAIGVALLFVQGFILQRAYLQVAGAVLVLAMGALILTGLLKQNAGTWAPDGPDSGWDGEEPVPGGIAGGGGASENIGGAATLADGVDGSGAVLPDLGSVGSGPGSEREGSATYSRSFLLGLGMGPSASACAFPLLVSVTSAIWASGDQVGGWFALFLYATGIVIPFIGIGLGIGRVNEFLILKVVKVVSKLQKVFAVVLLVLGTVLLWDALKLVLP